MNESVKTGGRIPFKTGDIIIIAVIVAAAGIMSAVYAFGDARESAADTAVIVTPDGISEYPLGADMTAEISAGEYKLTVVISGGEIYVSDSDCPDGTCMSMGRISRGGETIICLPARVMITVKSAGSREGGIDAVAG